MKYKVPIRRRILIAAMALCLTIGSVFGIMMPAKAASYASKWAWRDESGNIYIRVEDKKKTSDIYYQTLGFTITRCVLESKVPVEEQYITVRFNEFQEVELGNGQIGTAFVVSEAELMQKIAAASGDWLADIQSGKTCYLRFDSIMVTVNEYYGEYGKYSGMMNSDINQDYIPNQINPHPGVYDKFCKDDLKTVYAWASPNSIDTHFDIWLLYNGGKEEPTIVSAEHVATIGKGISPTAVNSSCHDMGAHTKIPEYFTWNNSDEFDLSQGIPSGENITNGYGADTWYGNADIHKYEEEREYTISYDLIYHTYDPIYMTEAGNYVLDADGNKIQIGLDDNEHHVPFTEKTKRKVTYLFAANVNLYELTEVDVYNSVYPGDVNIWTFPGNTVQMEVSLDGEINPSVAPDWNTDPETHIIWPEWYSDTVEIDVGEGAGAAAAKEREIRESLAAAWENNVRSEYDPIEEVESWNDLIEVNYIKYLDNEPVKALDTSRIYINYKDMPAGKADSTYLFKEGQVTVTIPKDVANGAYSTSVDVLYIRRILNDSMVKAFSTEDAGDSIYNHLKSGYEQNEPVYVHTPVISPVSITNGEESTQLITENLTSHTGMVDKDGRVPDGKAIYELILDNEYTFKFDPALHREIQGYGWSGDPSKYDKYVKDKWVRYPFAVQMYDEFYDIEEDTGYTEWIKLKKEDYLESSFYIPPWAIESSYYEIQYKVEAYNVLDENGGDHTEEQEGTANTTTNENNEAITYVANYVVPVELSGIIYNFEIIGTDYYQDYNFELEDGSLAFCPRKYEKKQGSKNRDGGNAVRYTLDGSLTYNWLERDTLPIALGSTDVWDSTGYLIAGDTFTFSVKTIANLWDEGIDSVEITPTFRWYDYDGTLHEDIHIYYWNPRGTGDQIIRYGSALDKKLMTEHYGNRENRNYFKFWNPKVAGSAWDTPYTFDYTWVQVLSTDPDQYTGDYHTEDLFYTLDWHNRNYAEQWEFNQLISQPSLSYCLSGIKLHSTQRLLTGNYEELLRNLENGRYGLETFQLDSETDDRMKYSMQTWYGNFWIPTDMMICDADTFEKMGVSDTDGDGVIDYWDYLVDFNECVDEDADFWLNKDNGAVYGYLMLNFDIKTINNGQPHLTYHSGTLDMWERQKPREEVSIGDPIMDKTSKGKYPVVDVPVRSGDVAIINPNKSIYDGYKAGTLFQW